MLKLNQTQEKLAKQKLIGHSVLKGPAKSGKTAVAIGRMIYLLEHACKAGQKVLFITSSKAQKQWVESCFMQLNGTRNISLFDEEQKCEAVIKVMDELIEEAADKAHVHLNLEVIEDVSETVLLGCIQNVKKLYPKVRWLKKEQLEFIQRELKWINSCGILTLEAYQEINRKGALIKLPKKGSGRKALWTLKEQVSEVLKVQGKMLKSQVQLDTLRYVKEDALRTCYEHVIIDDAHTLTKVQLEFIQYLKAQSQGEVLFVVDKNESCRFNPTRILYGHAAGKST